MRLHGSDPKTVAVLHGGPGAAGEVQPLAEALAVLGFGVLEPFQTRDTLAGQVAELRDKLKPYAPVHLIGWSWGAWLALLFAAENARAVRQVILVGSGPFRADDADRTRETRRSRLSAAEQQELDQLKKQWDRPPAFARSLALYQKMDAHTPDRPPYLDVQYDAHIHRSVWAEVAALRTSGALLERAARVACPVLALHGDYDPHPADGVFEPLAARLGQFNGVLFAKCGHKPWEERYARASFLDALTTALTTSDAVPPGQN
ncbi:MAG: alpha/beta hydrolase [Pseudomonadota bacterium]